MKKWIIYVVLIQLPVLLFADGSHISIFPNFYDFSEVTLGDYQDYIIKIQNSGNQKLIIYSANFENNLPCFKIISVTPPFTVRPSETHELRVRFSPDQAGYFEDVLLLANNSGENPFYFYLTGTGLTAVDPQIKVSAETIDFGSVFVDSTQADSFYVKNIGVNPLTIESCEIVGSGNYYSSRSLAGNSIIANDSDYIIVNFHPQTTGVHQADLLLVNNDPDNDSLYIRLYGNGIEEGEPPSPDPPGLPGSQIPTKPDPHLYLAWEDAFTSQLSNDWIFRNQSRWSLNSDTTNSGMFINTSDYTAGMHDDLGEYAIFTKYGFYEYTLKIKVRTLETLNKNTDSDFGVITRYADSLHYDYILFNYSKYLAGYYRVTPADREIIKEVIHFAIPDTNFHDIEIFRQDSELWVSFDEQTILYTDYVDSMTFVGFGSYDDAACFKDFQVWVNDLSVIPPDTFSVLFEVIPDSLPLSEFTLNDSIVNLPSICQLIANETVTVGVDSIFPGNDGGRYIINNIHGITKSQSDVIINSNDTIQFIFDYQYFLDIESCRGNPQGEGWFNKGTNCTFSVDSVIYPQNDLGNIDSSSIRYKFNQWAGEGNGAYSGGNNSADIFIYENINETALWKTQFSFNLFVNDTTYGKVKSSSLHTWQDSSTTLSLLATPNFDCFFVRWEGSVNDTSDSIQVTLNEAKSITAVFTNENLFPQLDLPKKSFNEDDTLFIPMSQFNPWVSDKNHGFDELTFEIINTSSFIYGELTSTIFIVWAERHSHGNGYITIRVNDPEGGYDVDTMFVEVQAVNDPPELFDLLLPLNNSTITNSMTDFTWQKSYNFDVLSNDTINYTFYLGLGESQLDSITTISDTIYAFDMSSFGKGRYQWQVKALDLFGDSCWSSSRFEFEYDYLSDIENPISSKPTKFCLYQNYPNPFNPKTTIQFDLPKASHVKIIVYSIMGERIDVLEDSHYSTGSYTVNWNGTNMAGSKVSSGIYFYKLETDDFVQIKKMMYMK